jgi:hypothetical protein
LLALAILAGQADSQAAPLDRIPTHQLRIRTPGVAVIRDSATWAVPHRHEVARLLLRNAAVRGDRELFLAYIARVREQPELSGEACRLYLARWPRWERVEYEDGRPTDQLQTRLACPEPPRSRRE